MGVSPGVASQASKVRVLHQAKFSELSESDLIAAVRGGSTPAAVAFFDRHAVVVQRVLNRIVGPGEDSADMVNQVFYRALNRLDDVREPEGIERWLVAIAVYVAKEHLRRERRRRWLVLKEPDQLPEVPVDDHSKEREVVNHVYRALAQLRDDDRVAFVLRYVEGLELTDVAVGLGTSLSTAKRRLARAEKHFFAIARREPDLSHWMQKEGP